MPTENVEQKKMATHSQTPHVKSSKNRRKSCMPTLYRVQNATGSRHHRHQSRPKKKPLHEYYNDDDAELEALHRYGTAQPKMVAAMVLDHSGRPAFSLTYGKLLSRATKVAYMLLTKFAPGSAGKDRVRLCKSGDRVALVSFIH
uniref:Uncharacterized protein n=1 Tax=Parascaris equorum TaxID=6256 RepID=A0A914RGQ3_PAREQ